MPDYLGKGLSLFTGVLSLGKGLSLCSLGVCSLGKKLSLCVRCYHCVFTG